MADSRAAGLLSALRAAARSGGGPFLVAVHDVDERAALAEALGAEGAVRTMPTLRDALAALSAGRDGVELALLDLDREPLDVDPVVAARALAPELEPVLLVDAAPERLATLFEAGAPLLLPRPLPDAGALLRAHARWLVASWRARTRGAAIAATYARHRAELEHLEPALVAALDQVLQPQDAPLRIAGLAASPSREQLASRLSASGQLVERDAELCVVEVAPSEDVAQALRQARGAGGAALLVLDAGASPGRAGAALYGGARAYLPAERADTLPLALRHLGARRRAELRGRALIEVLARFGVFDPAGAGAAPGAGALGAAQDAFVPSGHEVLVVDDEIVVLTVLREALRRGGYRVTTARSAEEAIASLRERAFDVVLTDKNLPGASGLDVLRFCRTLERPPAGLLITGYSSYDSAVTAHDLGALDYIEKPIRDVELLRQRVRRALNRRDEQLAHAAAAQAPGGGPARVLLVEVAADKRRMLGDFLARSYRVTTAADGDEALALLQAERFDVVIADRNLPGMMGLRVLEQAKQILPYCAAVLYTAYPSYEVVKEAFEVGADAFAARPSEDLRALEEKVAGALRGKGGILLG